MSSAKIEQDLSGVQHRLALAAKLEGAAYICPIQACWQTATCGFPGDDLLTVLGCQQDVGIAVFGLRSTASLRHSTKLSSPCEADL